MTHTNRIVLASCLGIALLGGCNKKSNDSEATKPTTKDKDKEPAATPPPANGVTVSGVQNPEKKAFPQYAGTYDKAVAVRSTTGDGSLSVFLAHDCDLPCPFDRSTIAKTCPKGFGVTFGFNEFKPDAKAGKYKVHAEVENYGASDSEFLGDDVEVVIREITDTTFTGSIHYKSDRGNADGTFKGTVCKL